MATENDYNIMDDSFSVKFVIPTKGHISQEKAKQKIKELISLYNEEIDCDGNLDFNKEE